MHVLPIQATQTPDPVAAARPAGAPRPPVQALAAGHETRNDSAGAGAGNDTRNSARDTAVALAQLRAVLAPRPDPDRPVGPPPAFEANLLETERERLRAGLAEERHTPAAQQPGEASRAGAGNGTRESPDTAPLTPGSAATDRPSFGPWGAAEPDPATAPPGGTTSAGRSGPSRIDITL